MSAYNAGRFLPDTLRSIQIQTVHDIRIIVVDDGSTDNTAEILAKAAAEDSRIHVITQPNGGIVAALNAGLAACTAPFIARHDADDLSNANRFALQLQYLEENPDCLAVAGPARQIDEAGRDLGSETRLRNLSMADEYAIPAYEPYLLQPMLMVRRDAIVAIGGYRLLLIGEDTDLYWRLRERGRLHNLADPLGCYRMHGSSITSGSIENGRRGALYAQLAAISAQRRAKNEPDLVFNSQLLASIQDARTLATLHTVACCHLTESERTWLALAVSAKLMEVCFYRPFELTLEDCKFIRSVAQSNWRQIPIKNVAAFREMLIGTAVRLFINRHRKDAVVLVGVKLLPAVAMRLGFRVLLPRGLRDWVKGLVGRK